MWSDILNCSDILILTYDLWKDIHTDDANSHILFLFYIKQVDKLIIPAHLFSNRSQIVSTCGKNISDTHPTDCVASSIVFNFNLR